MDGVLSQEEISALLNNPDDANKNDLLTDAEKDAIGEIGNISMGTAATTLFSLVNRKVDISTPVVSFATWSDICDAYEKPCVFIRIAYTVGLDGSNILVLKEHDVKVITDLMMGGDGTNTDGELGELHLSAISEAMNQMMGSAATSLSSMLNKTIDISPPVADLVDLHDNIDEGSIADFLSGSFVKISFKMDHAVVSGFFCEGDVRKHYKEYGSGYQFHIERGRKSSECTASCTTASDGTADGRSAGYGTANDGAADDGTADDGTANDGTEYESNVCTAGKCTAGTVSGF